MIAAPAILKIKELDSLVEFLADELNWPIDPDDFEAETDTFQYSAEELGLDDKFAAKVNQVVELRRLNENQPYAIFWIDFETKRLPVTAMRRILREFVLTKRGTKRNNANWEKEDIIFISGFGEQEKRGIAFAHFHNEDGKEIMREFYWDQGERKLDHIGGYLENLTWPQDEYDTDAWRQQWRLAFSGSTRETIRTSEQLAKSMAWIARDIRDRVSEVYAIEHEDGALHKLFRSFKDGLIHDMSEQQFADMYAQTMTYGLFSARTMDFDGHFEMHEVVDLIPSTNPFLKQLFKECLSAGIDGHHIDLDELGLGRLVDLLDSLNKGDGRDMMKDIVDNFGRRTLGGVEDPVIHFYELFLKEYDRIQRIDRGVYYTPDAVVDFIVRSVNEQLKTEFGLEMGLADITTWGEMVASGRAEMPLNPKTNQKFRQDSKDWKGEYGTDGQSSRPFVQILDPATGTGTFLIRVITEIHNEVKAKHKRDRIDISWEKYWNDYVESKLFPRLYGFELMMASYSVAHMRIGMHLKALGYEFKKGQRLNVFLTNTLESPDEMGHIDLFYSSIGTESHEAKLVKRNRIFSVVIGNPPYNGESKNKGKWIMSLMNDYKKEPETNTKLNERNPKMINDDYIKFIRFSQAVLTRSCNGIIGLINPHGFLFSPTLRGVRWSLINAFNKIKILDLNGGSRPRLFMENGTPDENVFDILQGVSINFLVKNQKEESCIGYESLVNSREFKYAFLGNTSIANLKLERLTPKKTNFVLRTEDQNEESENIIRFDDLFIFNSTGIQTDNDNFCIQFNSHETDAILEDLLELSNDDIRKKYDLKVDSSAWSLSSAIKDIRTSQILQSLRFEKVNYRPFDHRSTIYTGNSNGFMGRPRTKLVEHLDEDNISLVSVKNSRSNEVWNLIFLIKHLPSKPTTITSLDANYAFPMKLLHSSNLNEKAVASLLSKAEISFKQGRPGNFNSFVSELDVIDYIYACLNSKKYCEKHNLNLKKGFPFVPIAKNKEIFWDLVELGSVLRTIHLLENEIVEQFITTFMGEGTNEVEKPEFKNGKVYINKEQYFKGVPELAWNFYIGGYQPAQKWLKDRKGRTLTQEDIAHYQKIIVALTETDRIMQEIDKIEIE